MADPSRPGRILGKPAPGANIEAYCRWNSLAGSYLFGGTPTVFDPRSSGSKETDLTNVHEQTHRDLINDTVYGYVLARLHELHQSSFKHPNDLEQLIKSLSSKMFLCAEGSATAMELVTLQHRKSGGDVPAFMAALPPDYLEAVTVFQPLTDYTLPFPDLFLLLAKFGLIHAVSEAAADWALYKLPAPPDKFWDLANLLNSETPPDEILPTLVDPAGRFPVAVFAMLFDACKGLLAESKIGEFSRYATYSLKFSLLAGYGIATSPPPLLNDDRRISFLQAYDAQLNAEYPGLIRHELKAGHIFGQIVHVDTQEPPFLLKDEETEPAHLLTRMQELAGAADFLTFVVRYLIQPKTGTYDVIAHPIKRTETSADMAEPYLISHGAAPEILRSIDASGMRLVWTTMAIPAAPQGFYDAEFVATLTRPVFLELVNFNWEVAVSVAQSIPGEQAITVYDVPGIHLAVAAIQRGARTVFGLTPPKFSPDFELHLQFEQKVVTDNFDLAVVSMVLMRQSRQQTI